MENSTFSGLKHPTHGYAVKQIKLVCTDGTTPLVNPMAFNGYDPDTRRADFGGYLYTLTEAYATKFEKLLSAQNGVLDLDEGDF